MSKPATRGYQYQPLVFASGIVCRISSSSSWCLIRHSRARMWVYWAYGVLPPGLRRDRTVVFIGRLRTYNVGEIFDIVDAVLLRKKPHAILDALYEILPDFVVEPQFEPEPKDDQS